MKTEIYNTNIGDTEISRLAQSSQYVDKITALGLKGQSTLINANNVEVYNFKPGTADQLWVFEKIFTEKTPIEEFSREVIPLEILECYEKALESKLFKSIIIWSTPSAVIKDPILVGIKEEKVLNQYYTNGFYMQDVVYFLARWGEELLTFGELKAMAVKTWLDGERNKIHEQNEQNALRLKKLDRMPSDFADADLQALQRI